MDVCFYPRELAQREMQIASGRIRTLISNPLSKNDNCYTKPASICVYINNNDIEMGIPQQKFRAPGICIYTTLLHEQDATHIFK